VSQPLISRPAYGSPVSQSGLPEGDPAVKGISLDPKIPGTATYSKPSKEEPREPKVEDTSMYRVDDADDLLKNQTRPDEIDHSQGGPAYQRPGGRPKDDTDITKYPYRDDIPNRHNASEDLIESVVNLWLLKTAHEMVLPLEGIRVATRFSDIETGLNSKTIQRAQKCAVSVKRVDTNNLRWILSVDAGNGPKLVKMKATRKGNLIALSKMEVSFSCSCKAWRWLGPEYHAKGDSYLDGRPVGTASTPDIKDPHRINRVCKHVAAVINHVRGWVIPKSKPKMK
jgi:hypothetical protein